jgi:uncharacterized protein (TIGR01777 family)
MPDTPKRKIIVAGGTGFLGSALIPDLLRHGYTPIVLTRTPTSGPIQHVGWDAKNPGPWAEHLDRAHAIVNLVGRTVDCRKTPANKRVILESRLDSVRALAAACQRVPNPPKVWVQAATAHIYGDTADELLTDDASTGVGFAPDVGRAWESALLSAPLPDIRKVLLRISFVLGQSGGPLRILSRLARLGLGGTVGSGRQYMSWLHVADLNAMILRALATPTMAGTYNATSPHPVTNAEFMHDLRRAVHRPWSPPVPAPVVRLGSLLLRTDPELALLGRRVLPTRLQSECFTFQFPTLPEALADLLP